jgi:hypothetical protein
MAILTATCVLGGGRRFVRDAKSEVFDVIDGLIQEHRDVVVVERVDDAASAWSTSSPPGTR